MGHLFRGWRRREVLKYRGGVVARTGAYVSISLQLYPKLTDGLAHPRPYSYSATFDTAESVDVLKHRSVTRQAVLGHISI